MNYRYEITTGAKRLKTKLAIAFSALALVGGGTGMSLALFGSAHAATTVTVNPGNVQWSTADTNAGGAVNYITDASAPGGSALQLTTDATTTAKAQYLHSANDALSSISELSYTTKQNSGPSYADPSYQLIVNLNGTSGFTTFVYEPYQNGTVSAAGTWDTWNVASGQFWSTRTVVCSNGTITGSAGGPASYTLADIQTTCPNAVVAGFGVNIGSNNPSYDVEADLVDYNGTTYDFSNVAEVLSPAITSPANGSSLTSAQLDKIDWTDVSNAVDYQYRAYSDASYTTLVYDSGATLTNSEIPTPNTPIGSYYVQVRAVDGNGNTSAWSNDATDPYVINVVPVVTPTSKDFCKNGGWMTSNTPAFSNQGLCVAWVNHNVLGHGVPAANKPSH